MEDDKRIGSDDPIDARGAAGNDSPEGPLAAATEYETFDLEYSEEDIAYYIVDEDDNELGFALRGENGEAVEYYYTDTDEDAVAGESASDDSRSPVDDDAWDSSGTSAANSSASSTSGSKARSAKGSANSSGGEAFLTRKQAASAASDLNALFRDGKEVYDEIRGIGDDFKGMLDFLPKKRK